MRELLPYFRLFKSHWFSLSSGVLLAFVTLFTAVGLLSLSGWFLSASAVAGLTIARETFNYMLPGAGVRGLAMSRTAGRWGERVVSHDATFKLLTNLRVHFFKKLIPLIPGQVSNLRDADILNRLVSDVDAMDHVYLRLINPVLVGLLAIFSMTALLSLLDLTIALTLGSILLSLLLLWPIIFYKLGKNNGEQLAQNKTKLRISALDWLDGVAELTLFGALKNYHGVILQYQSRLLKNQYIHAHVTGIASALLLFITGCTLVLILWLSADGIAGVQATPFIALVAFTAMASFELLIPIAGAFQYLSQTLTSAKRLNDITQSTSELSFPSHSAAHSDLFNLDFSDVSFSYPNTEHQILSNINLSIKAGEKVAIVGQTGSGKSTLLNLISRCWDVTEGQISIAGIPLKQWSEKELRESMTVVSQRVDILNGTLRDNLVIAAPTATDEKLSHILDKMQLGSLLEDKGLDMWLGDGGRQLSGGERRRIGVARALLHDAPILLLDEPTEGLDKITEQLVIRLLADFYLNKTVIFITHRLIGLEKMDSICLLESGSVAEQGTHDELTKKKGRYYQLTQSIP